MRVLVLSLLLGVVLPACGTEEQEPPPNVVVILADDLGWNDVGFTGGELPTPEIDRLARSGVILDRFYCQPKCTPTRAGILTGRHPIRFGMQHHVVAPWETHGLPTAERTLAEAFGEAGYPHRAIFGKWHLGHAEAEHHPLDHGFTEFVGHVNGRIDYFEHARETAPDGSPALDWMRDRELEDRRGVYATDLVANEAIAFLEARAADREAFFLYLPFLAPHWPNQAPPDYVKRFADLPEPRRTYAAKVAAMDAAIGRIRRAIDDSGLAPNTLVLFLSDNGADPSKGGSNAPLAGAKHTALEGGVRCVATARWTGRLDGGTRTQALTTYLDLFPTFAALAGFDAAEVDGVDRFDAWRGGDADSNEHFCYLRTPDGMELLSLQDEEFKLLRFGRRVWEPSMPREDVRLIRYLEDPLERTDCAAAYPDVVEDMLARLAELRALGTRKGDPQLSVRPLPPDGWTAPPDWRPGAHADR